MSPSINGRIDPATGAFTPHPQPVRERATGVRDVDRTIWIDPDTATHEARHVASGLLRGVRMFEARADNPTADAAGHVLFASSTPSREKALMCLAGKMGEPDWPPEWPAAGAIGDEGSLAEHIDALGLGRAGWAGLVAEAEQLAATPQFKSLVGVVETLLERGLVLDADRLELIHKSVGGCAIDHKTLKAATRVGTDLGDFTAIAAAYTVDAQKEQIVRGAFEKSLAAWRFRQRPIPLHWAHLGDPEYVIGQVDTRSAREIPEGLFVKGRVDFDHSDTAEKAWRLVKAGNVALSFGFLATDTFKRSDGITELREIDLFEVSLTPSPANPDTRILSFKSADEADEPEPIARTPEQERIATEWRDRIRALFGTPLEPEQALEREEKRQRRELRRKCDRLQLEQALGWDTDLIERPPP